MRDPVRSGPASWAGAWTARSPRSVPPWSSTRSSTGCVYSPNSTAGEGLRAKTSRRLSLGGGGQSSCVRFDSVACDPVVDCRERSGPHLDFALPSARPDFQVRYQAVVCVHGLEIATARVGDISDNRAERCFWWREEQLPIPHQD